MDSEHLRPKMLLLEPDFLWRRTMARFAEKHGFRVQLVTSFSELKKRWHKFEPDVLVTSNDVRHHKTASEMTYLFGRTPTLIIYGASQRRKSLPKDPYTEGIARNQGAISICEKAKNMIKEL
ncbi:response regulator [Pseudobacteriovorax antillogorgiicola]|uniref:Response regulatory domain-containing protein n=1 Tax=Pseudobacteriovorax antillogorgiicola TaxID=1513793 RepID=A0A1Y6BQA6_9BACT|nr:response regulator [Pseudobacteriovorax antillogorgiicola]TCS53748.1 hypothetical protein EDD56_10757 [Pseudobacteriovorax antillogorgiicola]SMF22625.1 hypothetical protein SAMN06296036_107215 [Pseudobacteriovorax antillogorgiicola]